MHPVRAPGAQRAPPAAALTAVRQPLCARAVPATGERLRAVVKKHPTAYERLRSLERRWTMRRLIVRTAEEMLQAQGHQGFHGRARFLLARSPAEVAKGESAAAAVAGVETQLESVIQTQQRQAAEIRALRSDMHALLAHLKVTPTSPAPEPLALPDPGTPPKSSPLMPPPTKLPPKARKGSQVDQGLESATAEPRKSEFEA